MKYKNLLFSSVGDKTDFYKYWYNPNKNYDIYLCYKVWLILVPAVAVKRVDLALINIIGRKLYKNCFFLLIFKY